MRGCSFGRNREIFHELGICEIFHEYAAMNGGGNVSVVDLSLELAD